MSTSIRLIIPLLAMGLGACHKESSPARANMDAEARQRAIEVRQKADREAAAIKEAAAREAAAQKEADAKEARSPGSTVPSSRPPIAVPAPATATAQPK
ncbi:hypothetical protein [Prosthecobacter sp.]|uniref:hypothetical protein n=1 Tax=Prosthecobacter sp. TaxID=1965333 RepID=UPI0037832560